MTSHLTPILRGRGGVGILVFLLVGEEASAGCSVEPEKSVDVVCPTRSISYLRLQITIFFQ